MVDAGDEVDGILDARHLRKRLRVKDIAVLHLQHERRLIGAAEVLGILFVDLHVRMVMGKEVEELGEHLDAEDMAEKKSVIRAMTARVDFL